MSISLGSTGKPNVFPRPTVKITKSGIYSTPNLMTLFRFSFKFIISKDFINLLSTFFFLFCETIYYEEKHKHNLLHISSSHNNNSLTHHNLFNSIHQPAIIKNSSRKFKENSRKIQRQKDKKIKRYSQSTKVVMIYDQSQLKDTTAIYNGQNQQSPNFTSICLMKDIT